MSDDLVRQIKERRLHSMYPHHLDELCDESATALTEARAEIERWAAQALKEEDCREMWRTRADAAESELSTLRARVREVVGPLSGGVMSTDEQRAIHQLLEAVKP